MIYHNGCILEDNWRQYNACAAILNFNRWNPSRPDDLVEARMEDFFVPETEFETNGATRIRIVFPVGSYVHGDDIHIILRCGRRFQLRGRASTRGALVKAVAETGLGNRHSGEIPSF